MDNNEQNPAAPAPLVAEEELKMPEERFTAPQPEAPRSHALLYILIAILLLLILIGGGALVAMKWGDQLMGMFSGTDTAQDEEMLEVDETEPLGLDIAEDSDPVTAEEDLDAADAELEDMDFDAYEEDLDAIDAEIAATSTAE